MKVFISWSGDRSRCVGDVLRQWFPSVLQAVRPYFSPDDVAKGSRWSSDIAKELEASRVGLLVITPENQEAPWLLFEAGALAKNLDRSKVCPLLFGDMEPTDVKGPLVQFQAAQFSEEEMKRVIKMMNAELAEAALPPGVLDNVFEMWWPRLSEQVEKALEGAAAADGEARRSDRDLLEEVLALSRRLSRDGDRRVDFDHPAWDDLFSSVMELVRFVRARTPDDETMKAIKRIMRPLEFFAHREMRGGPRRAGRTARHLMMEIDELLSSEVKSKAASEPSTDVAES
ncbi:MAG: TIR domain-containing protein [Planctomycetota bacterium]